MLQVQQVLDLVFSSPYSEDLSKFMLKFIQISNVLKAIAAMFLWYVGFMTSLIFWPTIFLSCQFFDAFKEVCNYFTQNFSWLFYLERFFGTIQPLFLRGGRVAQTSKMLTVLVCQGCCNRVPHVGWLEQQTFIVSWFWRQDA